MIQFKFTGSPEALVARLNGTRAKAIAGLRDAMVVAMGQLKAYITTQKLSGQVLHHRKGNLIRATNFDVTEDGSSVTGRVFVGREAWYGRVHEYGARIPAVEGKLMVFRARTGETVFTMRHRAFNLPERSFMRTSLRERREEIIGTLARALKRAIET